MLEHEQILEKIGQMLVFFFLLKDWLGIGISCQGVGGVAISGGVPEASEWAVGDMVFRVITVVLG